MDTNKSSYDFENEEQYLEYCKEVAVYLDIQTKEIIKNLENEEEETKR